MSSAAVIEVFSSLSNNMSEKSSKNAVSSEHLKKKKTLRREFNEVKLVFFPLKYLWFTVERKPINEKFPFGARSRCEYWLLRTSQSVQHFHCQNRCKQQFSGIPKPSLCGNEKREQLVKRIRISRMKGYTTETCQQAFFSVSEIWEYLRVTSILFRSKIFVISAPLKSQLIKLLGSSHFNRQTVFAP